jgi:hypothetical protein
MACENEKTAYQKAEKEKKDRTQRPTTNSAINSILLAMAKYSVRDSPTFQ